MIYTLTQKLAILLNRIEQLYDDLYAQREHRLSGNTRVKELFQTIDMDVDILLQELKSIDAKKETNLCTFYLSNTRTQIKTSIGYFNSNEPWQRINESFAHAQNYTRKAIEIISPIVSEKEKALLRTLLERATLRLHKQETLRTLLRNFSEQTTKFSKKDKEMPKQAIADYVSHMKKVLAEILEIAREDEEELQRATRKQYLHELHGIITVLHTSEQQSQPLSVLQDNIGLCLKKLEILKHTDEGIVLHTRKAQIPAA